MSDPAPHDTLRLRQLAVFLEVASRLSFVRAAEALQTTQPSTSRTISQLEEALGVRLFERSRRGVWLTPEGEAFRHHAGAAIASVRRGISAARSAASAPPVLRLGALPTVAGRLIPTVVHDLRERGEHLRIRILTGPQSYLVEALRSRECDVLVGRMPSLETLAVLSFERLFNEQIVLVARSGHPMCEAGARFEDLLEYTVLLPTPNALIRPQVDRMLVGVGLAELPDVIETVSPSFSLAFLKRTDAVWIISRSVVQEAVDLGDLQLIPLHTGVELGAVGLCTLQGEPTTPAQEAVRESLRRCAQRLYPQP